jgi:peptidoglycan/xylan/chitin deacetylase (PgdA/CDA1 family)
MRTFLGILLLVALSVSTCFAEGRVIVLCYHSFLGENYDTDFSPEEFQNQIKAMKSLGYHFVSFQDILSNEVTGSQNILITIDDGNRSVKNIYESVLKENEIQPILFIYPGITGKMHYSLTFHDLKNYLKEGVTIGAHGYTHEFVNQKLYDSNKKSFMREIYQSRSKLERSFSSKIAIYAYPFGSFSQITIDTLKKAGFEYSFSLKHNFLKVPLAENEDPYNLPRYMVTKSNWKGVFSLLKKNGVSLAKAKKRE